MQPNVHSFTEPTTHLVRSADGTEIAMHELTHRGPALLVTHAQGFHGYCYESFARALDPAGRVLAVDVRGHGHSPADPAKPVDWEDFFADVEACGRSADEGAGIRAFGHSMGAALLLRVAERAPGLFSRLVIYEPALFPPSEGPEGVAALGRKMGATVRGRRATFVSYAEAAAHYRSKPPMNHFDERSLRNYIEHGFDVADDGSLCLRCTPDFEAQSYETYPVDDFWNRLGTITVPTLVLTGEATAFRPSDHDEKIAGLLPNGTFRRLEGVTHFAPMTHPALMAAAVSAWLGDGR